MSISGGTRSVGNSWPNGRRSARRLPSGRRLLSGACSTVSTLAYSCGTCFPSTHTNRTTRSPIANTTRGNAAPGRTYSALIVLLRPARIIAMGTMRPPRQRVSNVVRCLRSASKLRRPDAVFAPDCRALRRPSAADWALALATATEPAPMHGVAGNLDSETARLA